MNLNPSGIAPKPTPVPPGPVSSPEGSSFSRSTNAGEQECVIPSLSAGARPSRTPAPSHAIMCLGKLEPVCLIDGLALWSCPRCGIKERRTVVE